MHKEDAEWLHHVYGPEWIKRLEQHIHNEVTLRRQDEEGLKMRKPWNY